jgi:hypothetical protein
LIELLAQHAKDNLSNLIYQLPTNISKGEKPIVWNKTGKNGVIAVGQLYVVIYGFLLGIN